MAANDLANGGICYPFQYEINTSSGNTNGYRLTVQGAIYTNKVNIDTQTWCDYVFEKDYNLMSLSDVDQYLKTEKHLPGIPSAKEVEANGIDVGEMQKMQMEKIENLYLYNIELKKENEILRKEIELIKSKLK